jgi:hypothetical protein
VKETAICNEYPECPDFGFMMATEGSEVLGKLLLCIMCTITGVG